MKQKVAIITGITGQDGSIMAKFLLKKKYIVHGIKRRVSTFNTERIDDIFQDRHSHNLNFFLHYGDVTDPLNCLDLIKQIKPDEIYHFAAQSHVAISFQMPIYSVNVDAMGTLNILESIRLLNFQKNTKFYNAASSEIFGNSNDKFQNENSKFLPNSPYASAKLFSYWITKNYRKSYKIFATNGILFNHESEIRGKTFVTRKITFFVANYKMHRAKTLYLGNLNSKRDWGYAKDYMEGAWLMMQQSKPDDYVLSTGENHSIKEFLIEAFKLIDVKIVFKGSGIKEVGIDEKNNKVIVRIKKEYFRPSEIDELLGDYSKAKKLLKWKPKITFKQIIKKMVTNDLKNIIK